jgi:hypothetical protein
MNNFIITDNLTGKKLTLTFDEFYDLKIGLSCAADLYGEANKKIRQKEFKKLEKTISKFCDE